MLFRSDVDAAEGVRVMSGKGAECKGPSGLSGCKDEVSSFGTDLAGWIRVVRGNDVVDLVDGMSNLEVCFGGRESQLEDEPINFVKNDDDGETLTDGMFDDGFGVAHDSLDDIDDKDKTVS